MLQLYLALGDHPIFVVIPNHTKYNIYTRTDPVLIICRITNPGSTAYRACGYRSCRNNVGTVGDGRDKRSWSLFNTSKALRLYVSNRLFFKFDLDFESIVPSGLNEKRIPPKRILRFWIVGRFTSESYGWSAGIRQQSKANWSS